MTDLSTIINNCVQMLAYDAEHPMMFSSGVFWALFLIFLPVFGILKRRRTQMMVFMILFSLFFYYKSSGWFMVMLAITASVDWIMSKAIVTTEVKWQKKVCLTLSLCFSLGVLAYFKYANFFLWNWNLMVEGNFQPLDIILPVGISFYTFQSASYIIDVYRGKLRPLPTFGEYLFFLSYFPALVAGPIVRADYFIPQLRENRHATRTEIYTGLWLVILGVLKKALIADYLVRYNDLVFGAPGAYSGFETLMGAIGYVMQIYCDFSGYSDMAIGISLMMGFRLPKNFDFPYKSKNITEFWRRWHISLSSWMRDYIYIPLGGNRKGALRAYFNNLVTMLAAGLWHGAAWKFIFWGGIHGIGLIVHKACRRWLDKIPDIFPVKVVSWALNMLFVTVTMVFFRAESVHDSIVMLHTIVCDFSLDYAVPFIKARDIWVSFLAVIIIAHALPQRWWDAAARGFVGSPWLVKLLIFVVSIQLIIQFQNEDVMPFIYFQF